MRLAGFNLSMLLSHVQVFVERRAEFNEQFARCFETAFH